MILNILLAAAVSASACPAAPRTTDGLRAAETAWVAALRERDPTTLDCLLDPDFSDNDWRGGLRSRAEVLAALPGRGPGEPVVGELSLRIEGDVGVVRGVSATKDAAGKLQRRARFTDVFVHRAGRWRAIAAQETPVLDQGPS